MDLKRFVAISPIIGTFFVFLGFLNLELYYGHWNLQIGYYLDFSEIILLSINNFTLIILFFIFLFIHMFLGVSLVNYVEKRVLVNENTEAVNTNPVSNEMIINERKEKGFKHAIDTIFKEKIHVLFIVFTVWIIISTTAFFYYMNLIWLYIDFIGVVQVLPIFLDEKLKMKNTKAVLQWTFIVTSILFIVCKSKYDVYKKLEQKEIYHLYTKDNQQIITGQENIFLGITKTYFFIYNIENKHTIVYRIDELKKIDSNL